MDLTTLLVNCGSRDNLLRKNAEEQIRVLRKKDPAMFICILSQELSDESKPEQARFLASILFKNTILSNDPALRNVWELLPPEHKATVKSLALGTLASPFKNARKGAAQAVSAIAILELPRQQWGEIITNLSLNAQGEVLEYKMSSLETLGYICEELPDKTLSEAQVDSILSGLVANLIPTVTNEDVRLGAITALGFCIRFCEKNFRIEQEKEILVRNILENCSSPNSQVRMKAMQCVLEVVRCFYDYIGIPTLEQIAGATFNNIKVDDTEEVPLIAIEVWCSICDEEIYRLKTSSPSQPCRDYILTAHGPLMTLLLECLKKKSSNDENDWNISVASACCISLVAQIIRDPIVEPVLAYISANLGSPDWKSRDAALLSFAAILKGPDKARVDGLVRQALPALCASLKDTKSQVRETAAWSFAKIANHYHTALTECLENVVKAWIECIKDKPRISNQLCFAIHNLADSLKPSETENSCPVSPYLKDFLGCLWENAFRSDAFEDNVNLANSSFAAFSNLVQFSAPDVLPIIETAMQMLVEEFDTTIQGTFRVPSKIEEYQGYLCSAMQTVFIKMTGRISPPFTAHIVDGILESFKQRKAVYEEGIIALSGLISAIGKEFSPHMEKFGPFLVYALKSFDDATLCRVSAGCVADLARSLEDQISHYLDQLMPIMMDLLRSPDTDRQVKLVAISALSDLALQTNKFFMPYLREVLEMLKSASELVTQPPNDDDPELPVYLQQLKDCLVESYTGIVFGAKEANEPAVLQSYAMGIFQFLAAMCEDVDKMDLEQLKGVCGLVGDLASLLGARIRSYLSMPFIQTTIRKLDASDSKDYKGAAAWASASISKALK